MTTVATQSTPAATQSTTKAFDPVKTKEAIDRVFEQSEPVIISGARLVAGPAVTIIINQGMDLAKTMITKCESEYSPLANAVLELAKGPLVNSAQASSPDSAEGSTKVALQSIKGATHKSVDVVDRSFTSIDL